MGGSILELASMQGCARGLKERLLPANKLMQGAGASYCGRLAELQELMHVQAAIVAARQARGFGAQPVGFGALLLHDRRKGSSDIGSRIQALEPPALEFGGIITLKPYSVYVFLHCLPIGFVIRAAAKAAYSGAALA